MKHASAHDLRRGFGFRWSRRIMPAVLKELMRHADIKTTMDFYVGTEAEETARMLYRFRWTVRSLSRISWITGRNGSSFDGRGFVNR